MLKSKLNGFAFTLGCAMLMSSHLAYSQGLSVSIEGSNFNYTATNVQINEDFTGQDASGTWRNTSRGSGAQRISASFQRPTATQFRDFSYKSTENYSSSTNGIGSNGSYGTTYESKTTETRSPSTDAPDGQFVDDLFNINSELVNYEHYHKITTSPEPAGGNEPPTNIAFTYNIPLTTERMAGQSQFFACNYQYVTPEADRVDDQSPLSYSYHYVSQISKSSQLPKLVYKKTGDEPAPAGQVGRLCWYMRTFVVSYDVYATGGPIYNESEGTTTYRCRYPSRSSGTGDLADGQGVAGKLSANTCRYYYLWGATYEYVPRPVPLQYNVDYITPVAAARALRETGLPAIAVNNNSTPTSPPKKVVSPVATAVASPTGR